ncbi:nucleoside-diphosphate sugar epimerase/dehydratase [Microbacterium lacticum]|uniref:CoA-binding protein n=1 Tax=Microbacterium lacticum TaxID=33885 RepID=A0A4Y3UQ71_9MICO|nr:hypothetical protein [Microbacterium lacticum]TQM90620.1 CoA-binding protein [Microbacterium lacticum]GEB95639.1 hypothetical protein MLA01_18580 [Microbacterium lacticum]GGN16232.1 hypothetical protein GCM10009724_07490 [Microbacterium lacticum]
MVVPLGTIALILSRWIWRQWLRAQQRARKYVCRAVVLGEPRKAAHIINSIRRTSGTGFEIVGVVTQGGITTVEGVPVVGGFAGAASGFLSSTSSTRPSTVIAGSSSARSTSRPPP